MREVFAAGAAYKTVFVLAALLYLAVDYIILSQSTTLRVLFAQNTEVYNWSSIILSLAAAVLFGLSLAVLVYLRDRRRRLGASAAGTGAGTFFGAVAAGCPVCGAWLLPLFGIAGSLAVFPFQGLEIKAMAVVLLAFSLYESLKLLSGTCPNDRGAFWRRMLILIIVLLGILYLLPSLPAEYKRKFQVSGVQAPTQEDLAFQADVKKLYEQINPEQGYALPVKYGNIGYRLVQAGVIDFDKFKAVYDRAGSPLTEEQLRVFTEEGLDEPIVINRGNSYFLLNLFWALGLANDNPILTEGDIVKYGRGKIGAFASTGGWTIAKKPLEEFYAKSKLITLTAEQQQRLQKVAEGTYRPCCGNSTAFPDCNHGMALLAVLQMLAGAN
ncbi:MAG TPA: hypothetical protein ENJ77_01440, partial [Candidatus Moranbacteria bacterium]|nr:hypothetical protein [Candidatus Moranbacteria bacterium]